MRRRAYIGLGANLGSPARQLRAAIDGIAQLGDLLAVSPLYRSAPMGPADQPDYCNAACVLDTDLTPPQLLEALLRIERACGRVRDGQRWGPRRLDLDLLHVEGVLWSSDELTLPHPGIALRNWVLWPLLDVAPMLEIPALGAIRTLAESLGREGLSVWAE